MAEASGLVKNEVEVVSKKGLKQIDVCWTKTDMKSKKLNFMIS